MDKQDINTEHSHGYGIYVLVWLGLLALTGLTIAVAGMNIGGFTIATALIIASVKGYLVLAIFMHLRDESMMFKVFLLVAAFFLIITFILLFSDYSFQ
ncbi:MAG: cytochrome C oxidase subunit IV family protein [Bacteroidetes bacterium]|nr:cytochrome C oxidase subunit IV family protein [Bacteroidota bacterium]MCH7771191.1 cytochrome C oxidase subunit IV family protein [Bacteroidota bacterium]